MSYTDTGLSTYPDQQIDPRQKGYEWILQFTRAAYSDSRGYMINGVLNTGNLRMAEIRMYTLGKQPVDKYKKMFSPGNPSDESWRAIDWTPPAFMCKYREIAISKLLQKKFDIQAFPVDPLSVSEEDAYFNAMRVKIIARQAAMEAGSEMANSPLLMAQPGEPEDLDQLYMQKEYGYKHQMAIESEDAINLVMYQNNEEEVRKQCVQNLYDFGIGARTQWIDENGMVKYRAIDPEYLGLSYFEKPDGSDLTYWFEMIPTYVGDLAPYYSKEQLDKICQKVVGRNGNPGQYTPFNGFFNPVWNRFKVMVCKIKFLSWNETIWKNEIDSRGNADFLKSDYANKRFTVNKNGELETSDYSIPTVSEEFKGEQYPKYINSCKKVRYKASWIVDTEYMHDWGLDENQNRKLSSWWDTDLDIQLYSWNFYRMQFGGISERLIPLEDKACMTWYNLQNLSNKLIPYIINLDMNAVEGAFPYGKNGTKGKPSDVIDFIFSNFIAPYRSSDLLSRNPNYKPVSIEATGQLAAFGQLYDQLQHTLDMMRQISGLNELTDGSTPNPKTLVPVAEAGIQATNNAIYLVSEADKNIIHRTADAIIQKVQIAVKLGKVQGYAKALGSNTVKFFSINPDISLRELGIEISEAPTEAQREALWADVNIKESQGLLTVGDKAFVMTVRNLRVAYNILDYKIQKRKEEQQQFALQQTQVAAEVNAQTAQLTEQMKQQTIAVQLDADLIRIQAEKQWEYEIERMKKSHDLQGEMYQADSRNTDNMIQSQAKLIGDRIAADASIEKQKIANKKPKAPAKKS